MADFCLIRDHFSGVSARNALLIIGLAGLEKWKLNEGEGNSGVGRFDPLLFVWLQLDHSNDNLFVSQYPTTVPFALCIFKQNDRS